MKHIRWNEPRFDEQELWEVERVLKEAYVNEGPKTKEFEVIVPDMTMIATATAVGWAGGTVVPVDVDPVRGTLLVEDVEKKITSKTIAIIPVHILGRSAPMAELGALCVKHGLSLIEDAAGALGSKSNGLYLGTIGTAGCFSLQSNKIITCGQGGIIVTNDIRYYETIRRLRDFGRLSNKEFLHQVEGYNLKFSDLAAAVALAQFRKLELRKALLIHQRDLYCSLLGDLAQFQFPPYLLGEVPLWVDVFVHRRKELVEYLKQQQIYTRECWPAIHQNPPYASFGNDTTFPNATRFASDCLWIPNGLAITDEDIRIVCEKIRDFYKKEI